MLILNLVETLCALSAFETDVVLKFHATSLTQLTYVHICLTSQPSLSGSGVPPSVERERPHRDGGDGAARRVLRGARPLGGGDALHRRLPRKLPGHIPIGDVCQEG